MDREGIPGFPTQACGARAGPGGGPGRSFRGQRKGFRPTTWEGAREFRSPPVRLQAPTAVPLAAFALPQPRVLRVLSIEDHIRLEVDLTLRPPS